MGSLVRRAGGTSPRQSRVRPPVGSVWTEEPAHPWEPHGDVGGREGVCCAAAPSCVSVLMRQPCHQDHGTFLHPGPSLSCRASGARWGTVAWHPVHICRAAGPLVHGLCRLGEECPSQWAEGLRGWPSHHQNRVVLTRARSLAWFLGGHFLWRRMGTGTGRMELWAQGLEWYL